MDLFRGRAQVLIATEAGGEGINLQFCHHMINFDLPWNPMRVEQRIGRVHRLGQTEDVKIYNLCTLGTIEEYIISLLHEKINLFELVIGELDHILERFDKGEAIEQQLAKALANHHCSVVPHLVQHHPRSSQLGDRLAGNELEHLQHRSSTP